MDELTNTAASPLNPISLDELGAARDQYLAELDADDQDNLTAAAIVGAAQAAVTPAAARRKATTAAVRAAKAQAKRDGVTPAARRAAAIEMIETTIRPEYIAAHAAYKAARAAGDSAAAVLGAKVDEIMDRWNVQGKLAVVTYQVTLPDGTSAKRTTSHTYTHASVGKGARGWVVKFHGRRDLAMKSLADLATRYTSARVLDVAVVA